MELDNGKEINSITCHLGELYDGDWRLSSSRILGSLIDLCSPSLIHVRDYAAQHTSSDLHPRHLSLRRSYIDRADMVHWQALESSLLKRTLFGVIWSWISTVIIRAWTSFQQIVPPPNWWRRWYRLIAVLDDRCIRVVDTVFCCEGMSTIKVGQHEIIYETWLKQ